MLVRVLIVEIKEQFDEVMTTIIVNKPSEGGTKEVIDSFWEELNLVTELSKQVIFMIEDLNARAGSRDGESADIVGMYGENEEITTEED